MYPYKPIDKANRGFPGFIRQSNMGNSSNCTIPEKGQPPEKNDEYETRKSQDHKSDGPDKPHRFRANALTKEEAPCYKA